jgi:murein DD-endopeptidase MepM/ murein hydrolase activator NlpD
MNFSKLKNIKDYSFLVIPIYHGIQTKNYKISTKKLMFYLIAYTIFGAVFYLFIFSYTPAKHLLPFDVDVNLAEQKAEINELNKKIYFLTKDVENLSSLNKKLRIAVTMGDSSLVDSIKLSRKKDNKNENPYGGNIFAVAERLFSAVERDSVQQIYFIRPIAAGFVSRNFQEKKGHFGIDYAVKTGTPVIASASGFVIFADYTSSDGYMIIIQHENNYTTVYKHCSELFKKVRDHVVQGETIALTGNSGYNTTGPHLHFEIWKNGQSINPTTVLIN